MLFLRINKPQGATEFGFEKLIEGFCGKKSLTRIDMDINPFSNTFVGGLQKILESTPNLANLRLLYSGGLVIKPFTLPFQCLKKLKYLHIDWRFCTPKNLYGGLSGAEKAESIENIYLMVDGWVSKTCFGEL